MHLILKRLEEEKKRIKIKYIKKYYKN